MVKINKFLQERKANDLLRVLHPASKRANGLIYFNNKEYIDFSSNDYLSLSIHPEIQMASINAINRFGTSSSASRLLSGDSELIHELEDKVADFKSMPASLVFNSGYQANIGIIEALYKKDDVIFSDKLNHASIIDGMQLSHAKFFRYKHNDLADLESLLQRQRSNFKESLIITETIFSMDGDSPTLKSLVELKNKYNCKLMVDEAHATGIFGETGSGMVEQENLSCDIDFIMGTFSKALGSFGAYFACSEEIKDYLVNTCRSFIYSTALPPAIIAANLASLNLIEQEPIRRKTLLENANYFREELKKAGFTVKGNSQIIPLIIGETSNTLTLSEELRTAGYWVLPVRPPTVPSGESRLRFSLTYHHNKDILEKLFNDICRLYKI